jgi:ditrans,polycis-polyprenyl diphosphate synthase
MLGGILNELSKLGKDAVLKVLGAGPLPKHFAIIMDGNRRYATRRQLKLQAGHVRGFHKLHETLFWLLDLGVRNVSVYAFSIENFKRSSEEVDALMDLALEKFKVLLNDMELIHKYQVKVLVTGDLSLVPSEVKKAASSLMKATSHYSQHILNICFAYTGCYDIVHAVSAVAKDVQNGKIDTSDVNSKVIEKCLLTKGLPPVDLLLRTSGEKRLSDFLLWQCGGAHLAFIETLWPDLSLWDLVQVMLEYQYVRA